ncbi:MAG TPA: TetR/AcrR family transcriptional regulator [Acidimicrobiales bacterium]|jgi:TetR/AcrR family transcriptional repressor of nem operon|nr:TetR/AcrR family transcriptional regulator [Acidimicrobiales bacterium]
MDRGEVKRSDTATQILDVAERLAQIRGFNAFSYADVAAELKISNAALHYHFAGKSDLGEALIARYASRFADALHAVDSQLTDAAGMLDAYAELYMGVLRGERMCLCGMLAAEYLTLPTPMQDAVVSFFNENEEWLTGVLELGNDQGTLQFDGSARDVARTIVSTLEGAMLVARPYGEVRRFQVVAKRLLATLKPPSGEPFRSRNGPKRTPRSRAASVS